MARKIDEKKPAKAYNRALALEKEGRLAEAAEAYREVLALDPEDHARQLEGVLELATVPSRIVDLGAGFGRVAVPLAKAGASVLAVDLDPVVFESGDWSREEGVTTLVEDMLARDATWHQQGLFQAGLCLGNTLALFTRHQELERLFRRIAASLQPGGCFLVDDFPVWGWEAVQAGDWPAGLSEDLSPLRGPRSRPR